MLVREMEISDLVSVIKLLKVCKLYLKDDTIENLEHKLAKDKSLMLAAEENGNIIGSVMASFDGWTAIFWHFCVHPDNRNHGVAKAMLDEIKERLRALGATRMYGLVRNNNANMFRYAQNHGFTLATRVPIMVIETAL